MHHPTLQFMPRIPGSKSAALLSSIGSDDDDGWTYTKPLTAFKRPRPLAIHRPGKRRSVSKSSRSPHSRLFGLERKERQLYTESDPSRAPGALQTTTSTTIAEERHCRSILSSPWISPPVCQSSTRYRHNPPDSANPRPHDPPLPLLPPPPPPPPCRRNTPARRSRRSRPVPFRGRSTRSSTMTRTAMPPLHFCRVLDACPPPSACPRASVTSYPTTFSLYSSSFSSIATTHSPPPPPSPPFPPSMADASLPHI
jgi:hypothetical protein